MAYVPLRVACKQLGLHANTLRQWADDGRIESIRTAGGQRRFDVDSFVRRGECKSVCYCRVSSAKQKDDLARQVAYMRKDWPEAEIVEDIGSGLNFKRKGLRSLLERAMRGDKLKVLVATEKDLHDTISEVGELAKEIIAQCLTTSEQKSETNTED